MNLLVVGLKNNLMPFLKNTYKSAKKGSEKGSSKINKLTDSNAKYVENNELFDFVVLYCTGVAF